MRYFTSDWHIGEDRIGVNGKPNLFYRPFKSVVEQNDTILNNLYTTLKRGDELFMLGDVIVDMDYITVLSEFMQWCDSNQIKTHLIIGNYDVNKIEVLSQYFDVVITDSHELIDPQFYIGDYKVYLNHYPIKGKYVVQTSDIDFAVVGHIHGLWKVRPHLINVSVDAWHFKPVSEDELIFCYNAMLKYYDYDVFT